MFWTPPDNLKHSVTIPFGGNRCCMVLFDSPNLRIEFSNIPCRHLSTTWRGNPVSQLYREGVAIVLQCCHDNQISKLLSDIRSLEFTTEVDQEYTDVAILQYAKGHGLLYQAVVLSSEVFLKISSSSFDRIEDESHHIQRFFSNQKDAVTWLNQVDVEIKPL